eukprot:3525579-Amphidinium_carterae.2
MGGFGVCMAVDSHTPGKNAAKPHFGLLLDLFSIFVPLNPTTWNEKGVPQHLGTKKCTPTPTARVHSPKKSGNRRDD